LDGWVDGGRDARRNARDAPYCKTGTYCVRLRDDSDGESSITKQFGENVGEDAMSNYNKLRVEFSFYAFSMENNEDFFLEINNGSGFTVAKDWVFPSDFANYEFTDTFADIDPNVLFGGSFSSTIFLRFRCDASSNADSIFIDDVKVVGLTN